ncbi:helix-turn-helix transcriptional regulator [Solirubrobacter soli]|uniref:helix-turn-helix transcriptional regulator n=1 Tax=Solirubrobacter soli TaxID=363832 RepID=UPI000419351A|nr:LuxR family transcriptional regulator [Solirubrobacter soli]
MAPGSLLERDREQSVLAQAICAAADGTGQIVSIVGKAGLGKTSLLGVAAEQAATAGFWLVRALGSELERDLGWGVAAELLEQLLEHADDQQRASALAGRAAPCELVLSGTAEHDRASLTSGTVASITAALTIAVRRLATQRPIAVFVDDVHWADVPSLRWLCQLATRAAEDRLLIVAGFRPDEPDAPRLLLTQFAASGASLHLKPLSSAGTAALLDGDPAASQAAFEATDGNPFLLDQLVRHLGRAPRSAKEVDEARPESLARVTELRLARLGDDAVALARAVAVLGVATSLRRAASVAELSIEAAALAAERLTAAGIFADRIPLAFQHPWLLKIVRDGVHAARMETLRRCAARVLAEDGADVIQAALHLLPAEPVGEPWAADLLVRAGRRAFDRAAHASAAAFLKRSLAEPIPDADRCDVMLDLGRAQLMSGDDAGLRVLRVAVADIADRGRQASVRLEVGDAFVTVDRLTEGISYYDEVLAESRGGDAFHTPALARRALAYLGSRFEPDEVLAAVGDAVVAIGNAPGEDRAALSLVSIVSLWVGAPAQTCATQLEAALKAPPFGNRSALEWSLDCAWLAAGLAWCDRYEERDAFLDALIERARVRGASIDFALGAAWRSYGRTRQGQINAAWHDIQLARAVLEDLDDHTHMSVKAFALDPLVELGRLEEAEQFVNSLPPPHGDDDITYFGLIDARGRLHVAQHRLREARRDFELLRDESKNRDFACPGALSWRPRLVTLLQLMDEDEQARTLSEEDLEITRKFGAPRPLGQALVAAAGTVEPDAAAELLEEAVAVLDTPMTRLDLARAEVARGQHSRRCNRRHDAQEQLRRGWELAQACGAVALADRARAELRVAGGRPKRAHVLDGPESLTRAECQIACLVLQGLGNREVAESLFVTRRTVETHLTSIYRKLDIKRRDDLREGLKGFDPCHADSDDIEEP